MLIKQRYINASKYPKKATYSMTPEFYVIHNTYNDAPAINEAKYMESNNNSTSFHVVIDDKEVLELIPENRNSWAEGDGTNGKGNRKGISIEIAYSKSGGARFDKAEANAAKYVAMRLKARNWGIDRVKKHQDFSGKYCPHRTLDKGWQRFLNMVQAEMGGQTTVSTERSYMLQGDKGSNVKQLQQDLNKLGYKLAVDSSYGSAVKKAVEDFQRKHKLKVDGSAGNEVFNKIKELLKPPSTNSTKFRVITGSFEERKYAEQRIKDLKKAGFDSFIDIK